LSGTKPEQPIDLSGTKPEQPTESSGENSVSFLLLL